MSAVLTLKLNDYDLRPRGFDRLWEVMHALGSSGGIFTIQDIERQTRRQCFKDIRDFVRRLEKACILECVGQVTMGGWEGAKKYKLLKAPRQTPSIDRDGNETSRHRSQTMMWNAMRGLGDFSKHDVALNACAEDLQVPLSTVERYMRTLKTAGYFLIIQEGRPRHPERYRLRPDLKVGRLPPRILRTKAVYDQNLKKIMGTLEFEEAKP